MKANFYQDVILYSGEAAPLSHLQSALFNQLHDKFVKMRKQNGAQYALAFPGINDKGVGNVFRIFGENMQALLDLDIAHICMASFGTMDFKNPKEVPQDASAIRYARKHDQVSLERRIDGIRKRFKNPEDMERAIANSHEKVLLDLPFIWTYSRSTAGADGMPQKFPLHILKAETDKLASEFNCYGLPTEEGGVPDIR